MKISPLRLVALLALPLLAACGGHSRTQLPDIELPSDPQGIYNGVQDGAYFLEPVKPLYRIEGNGRQEVDYTAGDAPGTIVVDTYQRKLYYVMEGGRAMRYGIAVGREGTSFEGNGVIQRKREWPSWTPTANMIRTNPEQYAQFAGGLPGGIENPLGARALYLYRGGRDTMFRIHGTADPASIGRATSAGCIRLFNQDIIDLFERVPPGAKVKVRTKAESEAIVGPYMDDAWGRAVPATPENIAKHEKNMVIRVKQDQEIAAREAAEIEMARKALERADAERLRSCSRDGVSAEQCPPLLMLENS